MLCKSLYEHEFSVQEWKPELRDLPENATVFGLNAFTVDVLIQDNFMWEVSGVSAAKKVFIIHCEQNHNAESSAFLRRVFSGEFDRVVIVSEHKRTTLRQYANDPRILVIKHGSSFPARKTLPEIGRLGFVHNCLSSEKHHFMEKVSKGFNSVTIGFENDVWVGEKIEPIDFEHYVEEFHKVDVFVNCVIGDSFGMTPMEAMASGIPSVLGMCKDCNDFPIHGVNCFQSGLRGHQSIRQIREWIELLISNRELNKRMGKTGRESVMHYFNPGVFRDLWKVALA